MIIPWSCGGGRPPLSLVPLGRVVAGLGVAAGVGLEVTEDHVVVH